MFVESGRGARAISSSPIPSRAFIRANDVKANRVASSAAPRPPATAAATLHGPITTPARPRLRLPRGANEGEPSRAARRDGPRFGDKLLPSHLSSRLSPFVWGSGSHCRPLASSVNLQPVACPPFSFTMADVLDEKKLANARTPESGDERALSTDLGTFHDEVRNSSRTMQLVRSHRTRC